MTGSQDDEFNKRRHRLNTREKQKEELENNVALISFSLYAISEKAENEVDIREMIIEQILNELTSFEKLHLNLQIVKNI